MTRLVFFFGVLVTVAITTTTTTVTNAQSTTSRLWGQAGQAWDDSSGNGLLRDFTNVGYRNGNAPLPEWPVGVNVLDFGAVPDDDGDDSQAFIKALEACPENTAVLVPVGKYIIRQQIRLERDYVVLRGADMYQTILYFPQYLGEIYPAVYYDDYHGFKGGFWHVEGPGTHRSIENLTFEFRPQTKMGFWEFRGANAIKYRLGIVDSWIRNIHFRNTDFGIELGRGVERMTMINLYFDHFIGRPSLVNSADYTRTVGYLGIGMGGMYQCLVHNVEFTGEVFHDFDIIQAPSYNVVSNVTGPSIGLENHSMGAHHNLYTDVHCGKGAGAQGLRPDGGMHNETYWGIMRNDRDWPPHPDGDFRRATVGMDLVFVGYAVDYPSTQSDTFYYENIDPLDLEPRNIYAAQMEYFGKAMPLELPSSRPVSPELTGDVRYLNPTDDVQPGRDPTSGSISFDGYLKFDLRNLQDLDAIHHARLQLSIASRKSTSFTMSVSSVADDTWTQDTITRDNAPQVGSVLDSVFLDDVVINKWWTLDVTSFVQQEWESGDKIVSLYIGNDVPGSFLGSFHSRENGNAPLLIIERVPSAVPGAPVAPTGMQTTSENGHILLDWDDSTEADFAYYNVYRTPAPNADHPIAQGLTMSEFTDISAESDRHLSEMPSDTLFFYTVTAVDNHGYESVRSREFVGNTLDPENRHPEFTSGEYSLLDAAAYEMYSGSIVDTAVDPEGDQLYFFKVSGPAWLNVAYNGTLIGTPQPKDGGIYQVKIQVNALGGRDHAIFNLKVVVSPDDIEDYQPAEAPTNEPIDTTDPLFTDFPNDQGGSTAMSDQDQRLESSSAPVRSHVLTMYLLLVHRAAWRMM